MKSLTKISVFCAIIALGACTNEKNFFNGEKKFIEFQRQYSVTGELLDVDSIGIRDVNIAGKYLILTLYNHPYFAKIYELETLKCLGNYFAKGQGPNDFIFIKQIRPLTYPILLLEDWDDAQIKFVDLEQTLQTGIPATVKSLPFRIDEPLLALYVNDTCLLVKSYRPWEDDTDIAYYRYNPVTGQQLHKYKLYSEPVSQAFSSKIATLIDCIKPDGSKIASSTGKMSQIDILDLTETGKNISVSEKNSPTVSYEYINHTDLEYLRNVYSGYFKCTDELIFAMYKTLEQATAELQIIDWNGNPVCKIYLDRNIRNFAIDNGILYGLNIEDEKLYKYDISAYVQ